MCTDNQCSNYLFALYFVNSETLAKNTSADQMYRGVVFYFEMLTVVGALGCWLHALSGSPSSSVGSQKQQDGTGSTPSGGVRFTVSRRRLSVRATLMGVFTRLLPFSTFGYFRKPRNEANECEQQEVCRCCVRLQHHS